MLEAEHTRVQREARRTVLQRKHSFGFSAVCPVTGHGVSDPGEVDADLMRASGLEPDIEERRAGQRADRPDMRGRGAALDRTFDRLRGDLADRDRAVFAIDVVELERIPEPLVRLARAREYEQTAGRQIEPVHEIDLAEFAREQIE